jgi:isovaleryl-CoA dehydrogenase
MKYELDMWRKFGDLGLLGVTVPGEFGGSDLGYTDHCIVMEVRQGFCSVVMVMTF